MQETWVSSLGQEDPLEKEMATHSSILAWCNSMDRGAWQLMAHGLARVRHDWGTRHTWHKVVASVGASGKGSAYQCRRRQRQGFNPWVGKIPGGEHGSSLQCSCLKNRMDWGVWLVIVHGDAKSQTWLSNQAHTHKHDIKGPNSSKSWIFKVSRLDWLFGRQFDNTY